MINQHNSLIGFLVYDAQRAIAKSLETALKPYEITPGQWNLINQLDSAGELSQKQLAERTRKEQATITRYLDTLERKGLVVRNQHKSDRRAHAISVTDKAHELVMAAQPVTVDAADRLIEGIDQADLDTFVAVLAKLKENADNDPRAAAQPKAPWRARLSRLRPARPERRAEQRRRCGRSTMQRTSCPGHSESTVARSMGCPARQGRRVSPGRSGRWDRWDPPGQPGRAAPERSPQ